MDLDYLNANARSMISPVVCSNIDDFSGLIIKAQGHVVAGQTPLYENQKVICFMPDATLDASYQAYKSSVQVG